MPLNRVQFQPGMSVAEFFDRIGSQAQCATALAAQRWPSGFAARVAWAPVTLSCGTVRASCSSAAPSLTAGTLMDSTKLPLRTWFLAK